LFEICHEFMMKAICSKWKTFFHRNVCLAFSSLYYLFCSTHNFSRIRTKINLLTELWALYSPACSTYFVLHTTFPVTIRTKFVRNFFLTKTT
jgi:hypothetical protein